MPAPRRTLEDLEHLPPTGVTIDFTDPDTIRTMPPEKRRFAAFGGIALALLGAAVIAGCCFAFLSPVRPWNEWPHVQAEVLRSERLDLHSDAVTRFRFRFGGQWVVARATTALTQSRGTLMELAVNPADPTDVRTAKYGDFGWLVGSLVGAVILFFGALPLYALIRYRPIDPTQAP